MYLLFPEIKPYQRHDLPINDTHTLYIEECGDPNGIPVLFIHGGPGAGCSKTDRRYFDPERYRIILFDQRGSGRSKPHAELTDNTTQDLIADIETIRKHLDIEQWVLFGGSWGSTLALLYAQTYPETALGMILRGIFLCRESDIHWFYQHGAHHIFPDYWQDFVAPIAEQKRDNLLSAYYEKLTGSNEIAKMNAAKAWSLWEGRCSTLRPSSDVISAFSDTHMATSLACIEAHYFVNKAFIDENQIILNIDKLANIPSVIIHGRYDIVCPLDNALALHQAWPGSELHIIRDAGHSSREPGIVDALVRAANTMAKDLADDTDKTS